MLFVFGPVSSGGYGAAAAVIGLLAANAIFKQKMREDVRADIGLFVLLILYSILIGFRSFGWLMLIGGVVVGALVGWCWRTRHAATAARSRWSACWE